MSAGASWGPMIEAGFWQEPEVMELNYGDAEDRLALLVLLELRSWSMTAGTDGFIPRKVLRGMTAHPAPEEAMALLVGAGLAEVADDGWEIDWAEQTPAEEVEETKARRRAQNRHYKGRHDQCAEWGFSNCARYTGKGKASGNASDASPDARPEHPRKPHEEKGNEGKRSEVNRSETSSSSSQDKTPPHGGVRAGGAHPRSGVENPESAGEPEARAPRSRIV